jgi:hypothetical protein
MKKQARQGDIFFEEVKSLPEKEMKPKNDNIVAYGEVTGHSHKIMSPPMSELDSLVDEQGDIYVRSANQPIEILHDEHDPVVLEAGKWFCITRQREYDPLAVEKERKVQD